MAVRCMVRVLLPLARVDASVLSYGCMPYGAKIIAFGLSDLIFAIVWLHVVWREYFAFRLGYLFFAMVWRYVVWREYYCLWPGLSSIAFGLCYLIFAIMWLYVVWREYYCLWPGLIHFCYHMAVRRMARALLP